MMNAAKRKRLMKEFKERAKFYDGRNDVVMRNARSQDWRDLATDAEAAHAPKFLTWKGRFE